MTLITAKNSFTFFFCLLAIATADLLPSNQIVIGIISTAGLARTDPNSYIKLTYSEFIETGGVGVKVVPIPWDLEQTKFNTLLESINGVLFTGGGAFLWDEDANGKRAYSALQKLLNSVVEFVQEKETTRSSFPIVGNLPGI